MLQCSYVIDRLCYLFVHRFITNDKFISNALLLVCPQIWLKSHGWNYCWLIYCDRKTLLDGKKGTADKTSERMGEAFKGCLLIIHILKRRHFTSQRTSRYLTLIVLTLIRVVVNLLFHLPRPPKLTLQWVSRDMTLFWH